MGARRVGLLVAVAVALSIALVAGLHPPVQAASPAIRGADISTLEVSAADAYKNE
jgi:hypothetical protein